LLYAFLHHGIQLCIVPQGDGLFSKHLNIIN